MGGWKKTQGRVPPRFMNEELCHRNMAFSLYQADEMPQMKSGETKVEAVGGGVYRVRVDFTNPKLTPTILAKAAENNVVRPDLLTVEGSGIEVLSAGWVANKFRPGATELIDQKDLKRIMLRTGHPGRTTRTIEYLVRGTGDDDRHLRQRQGRQGDGEGGRQVSGMTDWFAGLSPIAQALLATLFTWGMTAVGAAVVFFFKTVDRRLLDAALGFAAGVMIAASFWSLLAPSITMSEEMGLVKWWPPLVGFLAGAGAMRVADWLLPHLHLFAPVSQAEGVPTTWHRTALLVLAITLHNIPEGLAVGVAFGAVGAGYESATLGAAIALAVGIGLQNCPEGTAVSVPLRREGMSRAKSFYYGQMTAWVEPVAGVLGAAAVMVMRPILPYALAFAAGAMIFVVVEEVIPESQTGGHPDLATSGAIVGFAVMMVLDVALG